MEKDVVLLREIQRNYRKLIDQVRKTKKPLYLGARLKPEAVLVDVDMFERLQQRAGQKRSWQEIKHTLEWIRKGGKKGVNLAKFVHEDRKRH